MSEELSMESGALIFATLADVYLSSGMVDEAISILKDGLLRNPTYTLAKIILGRAYFMKGDINEARNIMEDAYKTAKDSENLNLYLGHCYRKLGEKARAIEFYEATIKINPENTEAKRELGILKVAVPEAPKIVEEKVVVPKEPERIVPPASVVILEEVQPAPVEIKEEVVEPQKIAPPPITFGALEDPIKRLLSIRKVKGAFISSKDGLLIHSYYQDRHDLEELCAFIAAIYSGANESARILKGNGIEKYIIEGEKETLSVINVGESLFTVVTEPEAKPGIVFVYARKVMDEIKEVLG